MQPAWLPSNYAKKFSKIQEEIDVLKNDLWKNEKKYLPSQRFDANFLEWFRVYKIWHKFLNNTLLKNKGLINKLFAKKELKMIIKKHIDGKENNHKILQFLCSLQILDNIFIKKVIKPSKKLKKLNHV